MSIVLRLPDVACDLFCTRNVWNMKMIQIDLLLILYSIIDYQIKLADVI